MPKRPRIDAVSEPRSSAGGDVTTPAKRQAQDRPGIHLISDKLYSLQIGDKLFKLSGASLLSDSPSYFTTFFSEELNADKTLFIDRSSVVFNKIYLHLQGYYIDIEDEYEYVYLFADAHYYKLPGLENLLYHSDIFTRIGNKSFRISKDLITSLGNFPNYFSVSYNALFQDPRSIEAVKNLFRPPHLQPPTLSNRSPDLFEQLLGILQGKDVPIKNEQHRDNLIKECRYFKFSGLEQRLIPHKIVYNPFTHEEEILLRIKDVKIKQMKIESDQFTTKVMKYSRPYVDAGVYRNLIFQVDASAGSSIFISRGSGLAIIDCSGGLKRKIQQMLGPWVADDFFKNYDDEVNLPVIVDLDFCSCVINEREMVTDWKKKLVQSEDEKPLEKGADKEAQIELKVLKVQFRLLLLGDKPWLQCVSLEAVTDFPAYHKSIGFL